jgi:DNA-binding CsgD family transcriptional regulator/tetratricopeptide (TPR) repeat protein
MSNRTTPVTLRGFRSVRCIECHTNAYHRVVELLERDQLIATLQGLLEDASSGNGRLALVSGEAGAGKSALLRHFADLASVRAQVLWGWCDPLSSPRPLGPLVDISGQLGAEVSDLLRSGERDLAFEATLRELRGRNRPSVVVLEDLHWADASTLDFVRFMARRLAAAPVLLVVSYRDDDLEATDPLRVVLGDLTTSAGARRVPVPVLSPGAVARLAANSDLDADELYETTGGNPFLVIEVIAAGGGLPPSVSDAVVGRVARLSAEGRLAVEVAAVVGSRIEPSVILGIDGVLSAAVDDCVSKGILAFDPPYFVFRHELVRQAVLSRVAPARLAEIHGAALAALRALPDRGQHLARLADHAEHAADAAAVVEFAPAAAQSAVGLKAHREAAFQYGRALRFADVLDDEDRVDLLEKRSYECFLSDLLVEAIDATSEAIAILRRLDCPLRLGDNLGTLSRLVWTAGRRAEVDVALDEALAILEAQPPSVELARAYARKASMFMLGNDTEQAASWGERAIDLAERFGDVATHVNALNSVGTARWNVGDVGGEELLLKSQQLALDANLDDDVARALTNLAGAATTNLDFAKTRRYLDEGMAFCTDHDLAASRLCLHSAHTELLFRRGDWAQADGEASLLLDHHQWSRTTKILYGVVVARVRTRRGDPDVWPLLDEALSFAAPTDELQFTGCVAAARAEAHWLDGRPELIAADIGETFAMAVACRDTWFAGELGYWLWRAGDLADPPPGAAEPFALHIRGDWAAAAATWTALGLPYEAATALVDSPSAEDVRAAMVEFDRLGARPMVAVAQQRLRKLGVSRIPRGVRATTRENPAGLTVREVEVLRLLEEGLRNADIADRLCLSQKTVGHHVSAVLAKLDVSSRGEAARKAAAVLGPRDANVGSG